MNASPGDFLNQLTPLVCDKSHAARSKNDRVSMTIKLSFIMDVCRGMKYLSQRRIVHRDVRLSTRIALMPALALENDVTSTEHSITSISLTH